MNKEQSIVAGMALNADQAARVARQDALDAVEAYAKLEHRVGQLEKALALFQKQVGSDINNLEARIYRRCV